MVHLLYIYGEILTKNVVKEHYNTLLYKNVQQIVTVLTKKCTEMHY
jgi:hypothetical protein